MRMKYLMKVFFLLAIAVLFYGCADDASTTKKLPEGFVYVQDVIPNVVLDIRYHGTHNFVGKPVDGYINPVGIISAQAADALLPVVKEFSEKNLRLKIFDAYRPQKAVDHFARWAKQLDDTLTKQEFYPLVKKEDLFTLNYIASKSGHSRGSTIDLTLIDEEGNELDMGSSWDYFGTTSWLSDTTISAHAQHNRNLLRTVMIKHGFVPYNEEWWHFTLANEPYPDTYFDFYVE